MPLTLLTFHPPKCRYLLLRSGSSIVHFTTRHISATLPARLYHLLQLPPPDLAAVSRPCYDLQTLLPLLELAAASRACTQRITSGTSSTSKTSSIQSSTLRITSGTSSASNTSIKQSSTQRIISGSS